MSKKKMLLINKNMIAGGIETSLISFVETLRDKIDIEIMLFSKEGILKDKLPEDVKVIEGGKILRYIYRDYQKVDHNIKKKKRTTKEKIIWLLSKLRITRFVRLFKFAFQKIKTKYDVVVCCNGLDMDCLKFADKYTTANTKVAMIHNDISQIKTTIKQIKMWHRFDKIISVSKSCAEIFKREYPLFESRIDYIYNFQNANKILELSNEKQIEYGEGIHFVTVARLSEEKAHLRTLTVLNKLKEDGVKFTWHLVGEGIKRKEIEEFIALNELQNYVILHGNQKNPYPYIKASNFLFLGSYNEAAPMVYAEAMYLGVPVITTKTSSAEELVGEKGLICDNSEEGIYHVLKNVLSNMKIIDKIQKKLIGYELNSNLVIEKILGW